MNHEEANHLLIREGSKFSYVLIPPILHTEEAKLCFLDHNGGDNWDPRVEQCCRRESGHVHAHVHHGDLIEDILLEECLEEAGCTLPMPWDIPGSCLPDFSDEKEHTHKEGCGHGQIAHGDHLDWLVPMKDGSFSLCHACISDDGASQLIQHGRLVKIGESHGRLKQRSRQLLDLFGYEGPQVVGSPTGVAVKSAGICVAMEETVKPLLEQQIIDLGGANDVGPNELQKTTIDVLGICCPAEVPLVKKILEPIPGVCEVLVNVATKTVTVRHDPVLTTPARLVKVLNDARLEASLHRAGEWKAAHKWPSPYTIAAGLLVAITFFHYLYSPLRWVGLGAVAVGLPPIILKSLVTLRRCMFDINVLMLIAVAGAIGLGDYLEAGSIVFLFTLADWLESRSSDKARFAISSVASLVPQNAILAESGQRVPVAEIQIGTRVSIKAGEQIPIDGIIVSGKSAVDQSSLTGESFPVEKEAGQGVWAGTMNMTGYLCVETSALAEDSAVSRMVRLVEEAQTQRSRVDHMVEKFAKYYTPVVVLAAIALAVIPILLHVHNLRHWLYLALVLLVVSCPCALVISTPVTATCAIAEAARLGLIVKGGKFLEALGKLKVVALDKTGTLTEGHFQVAEVLALNRSMDSQILLSWVSSIESKSSHPVASAIVAYAKVHGIEPASEVEDFTMLVGEGVRGMIDGHNICIGNERLADRFHWAKDEMIDPRVLEAWKRKGLTICWVSVDERLEMILSAGDRLRAEAPEAVVDLRKCGLHISMLTGDSLAVANAVQAQVGEIEVHAQLLPEDKVQILSQLKAGGLTAMVGDGINDAPALAAADVGIAMGVAGSAIAMETADIALMTNDLRKLAVAVKLGRKANVKIQQNIALSVATKLLIIALAAAGYASLWGAVLADVGTCLVVIFNSMLLLRTKKHDNCCGDHHGHCHQNKWFGLKNRSNQKHHHDHHHHKQSKKCAEGDECCSGNFHDQEERCMEMSCCDTRCKTTKGGIRRRMCHKETCSADCEGLNCSSITSEGSGMLANAFANDSSECCSTKDSNSEKARSHKDMRWKDCQRSECCLEAVSVSVSGEVETARNSHSHLESYCGKKPRRGGGGSSAKGGGKRECHHNSVAVDIDEHLTAALRNVDQVQHCCEVPSSGSHRDNCSKAMDHCCQSAGNGESTMDHCCTHDAAESSPRKARPLCHRDSSPPRSSLINSMEAFSG